MIGEFRSRVRQALDLQNSGCGRRCLLSCKVFRHPWQVHKGPRYETMLNLSWPFCYELYATVMVHGGGTMSLARTAALEAQFCFYYAARQAQPVRIAHSRPVSGWEALIPMIVPALSHTAQRASFTMAESNLFCCEHRSSWLAVRFHQPALVIDSEREHPVNLPFNGRPSVEVVGTIADGQLLLIAARPFG
jgi:hypothetical protein